jgi:hypothetical protein
MSGPEDDFRDDDPHHMCRAEIERLQAEVEKLRERLVQMEKDHREDLQDAAAQARMAERFPDVPPGSY